jgi:hypothetical protein
MKTAVRCRRREEGESAHHMKGWWIALVPLHSDFDRLSEGGTKLRLPAGHIPKDWIEFLQGSISKSQNHCAEVLAVVLNACPGGRQVAGSRSGACRRYFRCNLLSV